MSLLLFQSLCFNSVEFFQGKIIEVILHLPNLGPLHLVDGLLRQGVLVSGVLDVRLARVRQECFSTRKETW